MIDPLASHGLTGRQLQIAARIWAHGGNTMTIAKALGISEARVHNNMRCFMPRAKAMLEDRREAQSA